MHWHQHKSKQLGMGFNLRLKGGTINLKLKVCSTMCKVADFDHANPIVRSSLVCLNMSNCTSFLSYPLFLSPCITVLVFLYNLRKPTSLLARSVIRLFAHKTRYHSSIFLSVRSSICPWINLNKQDWNWSEFSTLVVPVCIPCTYCTVEQNLLT